MESKLSLKISENWMWENYMKNTLRDYRQFIIIWYVCHMTSLIQAYSSQLFYRGADKSLARPTSWCILFDGYNISFDASLVILI